MPPIRSRLCWAGKRILISSTASLERFAPIVIDDPADSRLDDIRNLNKSDSRPDLPGGKGLVIAVMQGGITTQEEPGPTNCSYTPTAGVFPVGLN